MLYRLSQSVFENFNLCGILKKNPGIEPIYIGYLKLGTFSFLKLLACIGQKPSYIRFKIYDNDKI